MQTCKDEIRTGILRHAAWMFTLFEELLMHRIRPRETERVIREYITFEITGWRELMKI